MPSRHPPRRSRAWPVRPWRPDARGTRGRRLHCARRFVGSAGGSRRRVRAAARGDVMCRRESATGPLSFQAGRFPGRAIAVRLSRHSNAQQSASNSRDRLPRLPGVGTSAVRERGQDRGPKEIFLTARRLRPPCRRLIRPPLDQSDGCIGGPARRLSEAQSAIPKGSTGFGMTPNILDNIPISCLSLGTRRPHGRPPGGPGRGARGEETVPRVDGPVSPSPRAASATQGALDGEAVLRLAPGPWGTPRQRTVRPLRGGLGASRPDKTAAAPAFPAKGRRVARRWAATSRVAEAVKTS